MPEVKTARPKHEVVEELQAMKRSTKFKEADDVQDAIDLINAQDKVIKAQQGTIGRVIKKIKALSKMQK